MRRDANGLLEIALAGRTNSYVHSSDGSCTITTSATLNIGRGENGNYSTTRAALRRRGSRTGVVPMAAMLSGVGGISLVNGSVPRVSVMSRKLHRAIAPYARAANRSDWETQPHSVSSIPARALCLSTRRCDNLRRCTNVSRASQSTKQEPMPARHLSQNGVSGTHNQNRGDTG